MKVLRLRAPGGYDHLQLLEEEQPEPAPHEMLVRIRACSLNFRDSMLAQGKKPCADGRILLSDGAGEVVSVGSAVREFKVGEAVVSAFWPNWWAGEPTAAVKSGELGDDIDGYAREYVCIPPHAFTKAPSGYSHAEAATLTCAGVTAWRALVVCGRVRPGDTVLTLGTGGVSLFAIKFAKAAGARVIATSSSDAKLEKLRAHGADETVNYLSVPAWGPHVRELTGGRGVDHVVEVGGPATLAQSISACRMGGHIALVGVLTGFVAQVSVPALFSNQIRVSGVSVGSRSDQVDMIRAIETNGIRTTLDRRFPLQEVESAFRYFDARQHFGKVCIEL